MKFLCTSAAVALVALLSGSTDAFVPQSGRAPAVSTPTTLFDAPKDISYGEESRLYRRTVYTHDDWVRHRSPDRFVRNIKSTFTSGIYKNVGNEVASVMTVASFVLIWNALTGTWTDLAGVDHDGLLKGTIIPQLTIPMQAFTVASSSLGLLLGKNFRKSAYLNFWGQVGFRQFGSQRPFYFVQLSKLIFLFLISCNLSFDSFPYQRRIPTLGRST